MPLFHVWFGTKLRQQALQGERREFMLASFRRIAEENEIGLMEAEAQFDHVHLLLRASDEKELARFMMLLKGISARELFLNEPELRLSLRRLAFGKRASAAARCLKTKSRQYVAISKLNSIAHCVTEPTPSSSLETKAEWVQPSVPRFQRDSS